MQAFTISDYLHIVHRLDLNMLVARWLRPVSGAETQEGYHFILEAARQSQCPYWLLDGRRRLPADAETTKWGFEEYFPHLRAQLGQPVFLSQLISPTYQLVTQAIPVFQENESNPTHTYRMRRFNDEAQAVEWLRSCQQEQG
ncbi:hypothetical protein [Hymenobacter sediminicola]|uniref:STAS/SEC14 domain-containing protein n=1 Tax=Hymenobacter sediminicola TaxID=2761579 RepID=A0A7G7W297_9BACT|nr:hypothetical protein [Hymenobacter sediminicola]QNH60490.1 hypothetical protein H4317_09760 [Hymenobacter sediminicola]